MHFKTCLQSYMDYFTLHGKLTNITLLWLSHSIVWFCLLSPFSCKIFYGYGFITRCICGMNGIYFFKWYNFCLQRGIKTISIHFYLSSSWWVHKLLCVSPTISFGLKRTTFDIVHLNLSCGFALSSLWAAYILWSI